MPGTDLQQQISGLKFTHSQEAFSSPAITNAINAPETIILHSSVIENSRNLSFFQILYEL